MTCFFNAKKSVNINIKKYMGGRLCQDKIALIYGRKKQRQEKRKDFRKTSWQAIYRAVLYIGTM